jgi:hypothetical protein
MSRMSFDEQLADRTPTSRASSRPLIAKMNGTHLNPIGTPNRDPIWSMKTPHCFPMSVHLAARRGSSQTVLSRHRAPTHATAAAPTLPAMQAPPPSEPAHNHEPAPGGGGQPSLGRAPINHSQLQNRMPPGPQCRE